MFHHYHRALLGMIMLLAVAALIVACGQSAPAGGAGAAGGAAAGTGVVSPVFAFSEAVVGRNRIAIGLVRDGTPVNDPGAKVHLRFFNLDESNAQPKAEADARYYGQGLPVGYYVAYPTLDKAGNWGVEVQSQLSGQSQPSTNRLRLEVLVTSSAPNVGQAARAIKTPTVKDSPDLSKISSAAQPNPALYQISLDTALTSGKPTALLFATPGFCRTAVCGPSMSVLESLQKTYGERINVIHVEVYRYPFAESAQAQSKVFAQALKENRNLTLQEAQTGMSDGMIAWGLQSEPWLFLIDAKGMIAARFEGGITVEELGPALEKLLAG